MSDIFFSYILPSLFLILHIDTNKKNLLVDAKKLCNYLSARQPPLTRLEYEEQKLKCSYKVMDKSKYFIVYSNVWPSLRSILGTVRDVLNWNATLTARL